MNNDTTILRQVWEHNSNKEARDEISHIRGAGRWGNVGLWERQGKISLKNVTDAYILLKRDPKDIVVLEWGPGGGTNVLGLSSICKYYYGVDISNTNLEASGQIAQEGEVTFTPILLDDEVLQSFPVNPCSIDVFLSTAVFQHLPSVAYATRVLYIAYDILKPKGIGVVQIRYQNEKFGKIPITDISEYSSRYITSLSFTLEEFWDLLKRTGFTPMSIQDIGGSNYATYIFKKE